MPSLPVNPSKIAVHFQDPSQCVCNFHMFLGNLQSSSTNISKSGKIREMCSNFFSFNLLFLAVSWLLIIGPLVVSLDLLAIHFTNWYFDNNLEYLQHTLMICVYGLNAYFILKHIVLDKKDAAPKLTKSKLGRILSLGMLSTVASLLNLLITATTWIAPNKWLKGGFLCDLVYCEYMSYNLYYLEIFGLIMPCFIALFLYQVTDKWRKNRSDVIFDGNINSTKITTTPNELSVSLLSSDVNETDQFDNLNNNNTPVMSIFWYNVYAYLWIFLYGLALFVSYCYSQIQSSYTNDHFDLVYLSLLFAMFTLKLAIKRVSRGLDMCRAHWQHKHYTNSSDPEQTSIELMTEFIMSYIYWDVYRYLFICEKIKWESFIISKIMHVLSELFETGFRPGNWYFKTTTVLLNTRLSNAYLIPYGIIQDVYTSNNEWKQRFSADIMLHFMASFFDGFGWIVTLNVQRQYFNTSLGIDVSDSFVFLVVSMSIDAILLLIHYIWFLFAYGINVTELASVLFISPKQNKFRWDFILTLIFLYCSSALQWLFLGT
ncbi:hypothetical protein RFI_19878 [Reticulomyxa filosa]|uniref:Uncharacterized protein n=1 Tax=Reticulomyxa filosa TaxID=46433 RepID=X6MWJ6_RETFI|nr:hypothetical protein RFI_19878 [Reticulomyxa filosa]|eukprot:ETO17445.1 hypothetical protein RFI_19878 [Reticulomyxa filosa]